MKEYPNIIELYEEKAEFWLKQRSTSSFFEKKYLDWMAGLLSPGATLLDLGCGDGWPVAHYFIERGFAVTGIDSSPTMITKAKARFPKSAWVVSDMRTLGLTTTFDAIIAWDSYFHLTRADQAKMFAVFQRHAATGTLLVFTSGPANGEAIGNLDGKELYHSSLSPDEYRDCFAKFGFSEIAYDPEDKECGLHTVWRCRAS